VSAANEPGAEHTQPSRTQLEQLLLRFEDQWRRGGRPMFDDYLPDAGTARRAMLAGLIHTDLEMRLRAGEAARVEVYLQRYPELAEDALLIAELVALEYRVRREREPDLGLDEYRQRFPACAPLLGGSTAQEGESLPGDFVVLLPPGEAAPPAAEPASVPLRYRPLRPHAHGGLGEVLVAEDAELHRQVALKRIREPRADDPDSRRRFLLEAEITGRLEHPGVVPVYGLVQDADGRPCYAMRFVEGETLDAAVQRFHRTPASDRGGRTLGLRQLLGRFLAVCNTIAYAHSRGILHRDLKPANVMLGKYGETLVVDWGLAKPFGTGTEAGAAGEEPRTPAAREAADGTQPGRVLGTPAYMSPEQADGRLDQLGPASDVYSLGATLYAVLAGRAPFRGTAPEVLEQVRRGAVPDPRHANRAVPPALAAVCRKAMARRPEDRYATAQALAADVERWLADEPVTAYREGMRERLGRFLRRHGKLAGTFAFAGTSILLTLTGALFVVLDLSRQREAARQDAVRSADESRQRLVRLDVDKGARQLESGDAFAALPWFAEALWQDRGDPAREDEHRVRLAALLHDNPQLLQVLTSDRGVTALEVSPDGRRLLAASADPAGPQEAAEVRLWDLTTGRSVRLPVKPGLGLVLVAFSPDGNRLVTASGNARAINTALFSGGGYANEDPQHQLARVREALRKVENQVAVWNARTGASVGPPWQSDLNLEQLLFGPDGRQVLAVGRNPQFGPQEVRIWDATTGQLTPARWQPQAPLTAFAFSPDGRRLAVVTSPPYLLRNAPPGGAVGQVRVWDVTTGEAVAPPVPHNLRPVTLAMFSPDGGRLLVLGRSLGAPGGVSGQPRPGRPGSATEARVWEVLTGKPVGAPLPLDPTSLPLAFSPEGGRLLVRAGSGVRVWDVASGQPVSPAFGAEGNLPGVRSAAFSPDGRRVITVRSRGGPDPREQEGEARVWNAATGEPLTPPLRHTRAVTAARFTPDGRYVLTAGVNGTVQMWDWARTGDEPRLQQRETPPAAAPLFSPASGRRSLGRFAAAGAMPSGGGLGMLGAGAVPLPNLGWPQSQAHAALGPDGGRVLTAWRTGAWPARETVVQLWDGTTGQPCTPVLAHGRAVRRALFSPDGRRLLTVTEPRDGADATLVQFWDLVTGTPIAVPPRPQDVDDQAAFSPDGRHLAAGGADGRVRVWDTGTWEARTVPGASGSKVSCLAFSGDGRLLLVATGDRTGPQGKAEVSVRDAVTGEPFGKPLPHPTGVRQVRLAADESRVLTAAWDGTVRVWDLATGQQSAALFDPGGALSLVAFSADGTRVLTGSADGVARVWDAGTFEPLGPSVRHRDPLQVAAFSPDGRRALTVSLRPVNDYYEAEVRVWGALGGEPVLPPRKLRVTWHTPSWQLGASDEEVRAALTERRPGPPLHGEFNADGHRVLLAAGDAVWVWDLTGDAAPPEDLVRLAGVLSGARIDSTGALVPLDAAAFASAWEELRAKYPDRFAAPPGRALAWHRAEAGRAEEEKDFAAALFHLRRLQAEAPDPALWVRQGDARLGLSQWPEAGAAYSEALALGAPDPVVRYRRGMASFRLEHWKEAAADFAAFLEARPQETGAWHLLALARLAGDDRDGYRQAGREVLARLDRVQDPDAAEGLLWACVLGPVGAPDPAPLRQRAEKLARAEPKNPSRLNTLGAVLYRSGDYAGAVGRLQDAIKLQGKDATGTAWDMLFLAMAHQRLGHGGEAKEWLARALRWTEDAAAGKLKGIVAGARLAPDEEVELRLLRREAQALIQGAEG
jgi:WD40 repeat protein/tetratricopeptide (TPR) repeat protein/tRNA A-37 threonylcarbamoyl transferase component Bud32